MFNDPLWYYIVTCEQNTCFCSLLHKSSCTRRMCAGLTLCHWLHIIFTPLNALSCSDLEQMQLTYIQSAVSEQPQAMSAMWFFGFLNFVAIFPRLLLLRSLYFTLWTLNPLHLSFWLSSWLMLNSLGRWPFWQPVDCQLWLQFSVLVSVYTDSGVCWLWHHLADTQSSSVTRGQQGWSFTVKSF